MLKVSELTIDNKRSKLVKRLALKATYKKNSQSLSKNAMKKKTLLTVKTKPILEFKRYWKRPTKYKSNKKF